MKKSGFVSVMQNNTFEPEVIVKTDKILTLFGPSSPQSESLLAGKWPAGPIVAADSGADRLISAGIVPDAVIGDLDSIGPDTIRRIPPERVHRIAEQETTDFEKCLTRVEAPLVLGLGFTGGRRDHELAAFNALVRHPSKRCILVDGQDVCFLGGDRLCLDLAPGDRVSLFPMGEVTASATGLRWPVEGITFAPHGRVGTSNEATGPVELRFSAPRMLVILDAAALGAAVKALAPDLAPAPFSCPRPPRG